MYSSLSLGVACARKSSTPASAAMAAAVSGLSPVIMTCECPWRASCAMRSFMPPLTMSFRWMTPSSAAVGHRQRRAAVREMRSLMSVKFGGTSPPCSCTNCDGVGGALAKLAAVEIHAAHARVGEKTE
jgi:hypothetical protein